MKRSGDPDGGCDADAELNELGRNDPFHKLLPLFFCIYAISVTKK
jgi:hypothetical protein